ncbi:acyl dehydratase MaoC [Collimonas fungivorans]|uniref:Acyl dehydratase MaoC n=1 Tax=Collimonas fungivorans TaxID=158899 RepID=A0A127P547_9BURK|nr:acyl dehydratase MaoC [Collimonas fungivorans]
MLPAVLTKFSATRAQKETELKAKGMAIDETYRDLPIPN